MPCAGHRDVISWLEVSQDSVAPPVLAPTSATSDTVYTGSFVDDGADMRYPAALPIIPGCGIVDRTFYTKGKPRKSKYDEEWTVEKEKALAGDMWRNLVKMRSTARVEVRDADESERREERKRRKEHRVGAVEEDGRIRITKPLRWGTFVIEGNDGRVIVVDKNGEYDSGRVGEWEEVVTREKEYGEKVARRKAKEEKMKREHEREAKAQAEAAEVRERREREKEEKAKERATFGDQQRKDKRRRHRRYGSSSRLLTPIPEADTPEESATGIVSPTNFFMTGAQSEQSSTTHRPAKLYAVPQSPTKSPPGAWPAPELSLAKSASMATSARSPTALSTITSVTKSDDSWAEQSSRAQKASAVRLPSSASSVRYSDATSSTTSGAAPQGSQGPTHSWIPEDKQYERSSLERATSANRPKAGSVDTLRGVVDKHSVFGPPRRTVSEKEEAERESARSTSRRRKSRQASRARSKDSWKRDAEGFEARVSRRSSRSRAKCPMASVSAFIQDGDGDGRIRSVESPSKSATSKVPASTNQREHRRPAPTARSPKSGDSRTSVITPYSWRRQVEEMSDHSTTGSNGSRSRGSWRIPSDERGRDGEAVAEQDEDARSVKSHSTYRAPTVEDAPDSEDGAQEWDSAWSVRDDPKGGDGAKDGESQGGLDRSVAGSARWSGKSGWGGDVERGGSVAEGAKWDGSAEAPASNAAGEWKDPSGYDEGNDTWLNSEVGGVKYREAEWRRDAPGASWRDV